MYIYAYVCVCARVCVCVYTYIYIYNWQVASVKDFSDILLMYEPHLVEADGTPEHAELLKIMKPVTMWVASEFKGDKYSVPESVRYPRTEEQLLWCTNITFTITLSMGS